MVVRDSFCLIFHVAIPCSALIYVAILCTKAAEKNNRILSSLHSFSERFLELFL